MKAKTRGAICAICLLLALSSALSGCGERFEAQGDTFFDNDTKITYKYAPFCYSPIASKGEIYGTEGNVDFYKIEGKDPTQWLVDLDGTVFYASDITLPAFEKMDISYVEICERDNNTRVLAKIEDADVISTIVSSFETSSAIHYPNVQSSTAYSLRFADLSLGLYYTLDYISFAEDYIYTENGVDTNYGKSFLYNMAEKRFVKAPAVLDAYISGISQEDASGE